MSYDNSNRLNQMIKHIESDLKYKCVKCRVIECDKCLSCGSLDDFKVNIYSIKPHSTSSLYNFGFVYLCEHHYFSNIEKDLSLSQIFVDQMLFDGPLNDSVKFLKKFSLLY